MILSLENTNPLKEFVRDEKKCRELKHEYSNIQPDTIDIHIMNSHLQRTVRKQTRQVTAGALRAERLTHREIERH